METLYYLFVVKGSGRHTLGVSLYAPGQ